MLKPVPMEIYRHFKGKYYMVTGVATHSETREQLVIYQALYPPYGIYARPLDMFMSEVDHVKYPDVKQKMRFEHVDRNSLEDEHEAAETQKTMKESKASEVHKTVDNQKAAEVHKAVELQKAGEERSQLRKNIVSPNLTAMDAVHKAAEEKAQIQRKTVSPDLSGGSDVNHDYMNRTAAQEAEELNLHPRVIDFLDSDSAKERIAILESLRPVITDDMIDILAVAVGVEIKPGDVYDRMADLRGCLETIARFEIQRLR